jgi:hypothetical protein
MDIGRQRTEEGKRNKVDRTATYPSSLCSSESADAGPSSTASAEDNSRHWKIGEEIHCVYQP